MGYGSSAGSVNLDSIAQGKPFFSSHYTSEFSEWVRESQQRWQSFLVLSNERKAKLKAREIETAINKIKDINIPKYTPPKLSDTIPAKTESQKGYLKMCDSETENFLAKLQTRQNRMKNRRFLIPRISCRYSLLSSLFKYCCISFLT